MKKVKELMEKVRVCFLATTDGMRPAVRPMADCIWVGTEIWMSTGTNYAKVADLRKKPRAEVCFMDKDYTNVRIAATVKVDGSLASKAKLLRIRPSIKQHTGEASEPTWVVLRLAPTSIRLMDTGAIKYKDVKPPRKK